MNDWEILGINQTFNISEIKKAYARQLKLHHPEEDPKGFQRLREAYGRALGYAEYLQIHPVKENSQEDLSTNTDDLLDNENLAEATFDDIEEATIPPGFMQFLRLNYDTAEYAPIAEEKLKSMNEFFQKVEALYFDFFKRIDVSSWEQLFGDELLWQLDSKELISRRILHFLKDNYYLPREVWKLLNNIFYLEELKDYLPYYYPEELVKYIFVQLGENRVPRYCYFDQNKELNYDEYLGYRESAFLALQEFDLEKAAELISKANELYSGDPDLYCLKGELYYRQSEFEKGKIEFRRLFKEYPKDFYLHYYVADTIFSLRLYDFAFQECFNAIRRKFDLPEIYRLAGICKFELKSWEEAAEMFVTALMKYPEDKISRRYLDVVKNIYIAQFRDMRQLKYPRLSLSKRRMFKRILSTLDDMQSYHEFQITTPFFMKCMVVYFVITMGVCIYLISAILSFGIMGIAATFVIDYIKKEMNKRK